ncbi:hypothetical protein [Paenibacillus aestuarii]|uniref:N-acetyltransferase domain-containing protein n=1 Tax=Paenibacillus aestuarii TaxID=516965 RepID=A0ABW0KAV3_9BACL|nr:hypothetical protein [Paenibacillus aestuarii]
MDYCIRLATSHDSHSISLLFSNLTGRTISPLYIENRLHFMHDHPYNLYLYEQQGQILGTLSFRIREYADSTLKLSEAAMISSTEADQHELVGGRLRAFAEQLASQHACTGLWWVADEQETMNGTYSLSQSLYRQESGYRLIKRYL